MTPWQEASLNAKYGAFWVSAFSKTLGKYRNVGKPYPTIRAALDACKRLERGRYFGQFLFVDVAH